MTTEEVVTTMALVVGHANARKLSMGGTTGPSLLQKMTVCKPHRLKSYGFSFVAKCALKAYLFLTRDGSVVDMRAKIVGDRAPTCHNGCGEVVNKVQQRFPKSFLVILQKHVFL